VHRASASGSWGDARESTPEFGERYLKVAAEATVRLLDEIEETFEAMPIR
jgi:creatinine amidohydrolase/Fe(II)-dependent formamide hydrolase-like protein